MGFIHVDADKTSDTFNMGRLNALIDGVFAITVTLLVLELRPPESGLADLGKFLAGMLPRLYIYILAFYSIANHWIVQQRTFRHITSGDSQILWLTMLNLLFITLMPASTALVGRYPGDSLALACFSANSFFHALVSWIFWTYVARNQEKFAAGSESRLLAITVRVWLFISIGWLLSILFGFINRYLTYASWVLWPNLVAAWAARRRRLLMVEMSDLAEGQ